MSIVCRRLHCEIHKFTLGKFSCDWCGKHYPTSELVHAYEELVCKGCLERHNKKHRHVVIMGLQGGYMQHGPPYKTMYNWSIFEDTEPCFISNDDLEGLSIIDPNTEFDYAARAKERSDVCRIMKEVQLETKNTSLYYKTMREWEKK